MNLLKESDGNPISVVVKRKEEEKEIVVFPQYDENTAEYKLGLWVRNDAQGVGTLTFVTKDGKFGALGHNICDYLVLIDEKGMDRPFDFFVLTFLPFLLQ